MAHDSTDCSKLGMLCQLGDVDGVRKFLATASASHCHVDLHDAAHSALQVACFYGHAEVVAELLTAGAPNCIPYHALVGDALAFASNRGFTSVVRVLLQGAAKFDVHDKEDLFLCAFESACAQDHAAIAAAFLDLTQVRQKRCDAFHSACFHGHAAVVEVLLAQTMPQHVEIHKHGPTAFVGACSNGHIEVAKQLLGLPGRQELDLSGCLQRAWHAACARGHHNILVLLLSLTGPRALHFEPGDTCTLNQACARGHLGVVQLLLSRTGERVVYVDEDGNGALVAAVERGHAPIVRELLLHPAQRRAVKLNLGEVLLRAAAGGHAEILCDLVCALQVQNIAYTLQVLLFSGALHQSAADIHGRAPTEHGPTVPLIGRDLKLNTGVCAQGQQVMCSVLRSYLTAARVDAAVQALVRRGVYTPTQRKAQRVQAVAGCFAEMMALVAALPSAEQPQLRKVLLQWPVPNAPATSIFPPGSLLQAAQVEYVRWILAVQRSVGDAVWKGCRVHSCTTAGCTAGHCDSDALQPPRSALLRCGRRLAVLHRTAACRPGDGSAAVNTQVCGTHELDTGDGWMDADLEW